MKIGVSSACLYPMVTEQAAQYLSEQGVTEMELFVNTVSEVRPAYIRQLKQQLDANGTRVISLHPYSSAFESMLFFSEYLRRFEDGLDDYRRMFEAARMLNAGLFVLHGCKWPIDTEKYCERFLRLREVAAEYGVILCQENVANFESRSPDFIRQMRRYIPELRCVLDLKQCVRAGADVYDMASAMGQGILHVHLSDSREDADCLPPGAGAFDFVRFFRFLHQHHPETRSGVLELYRTNFGPDSDLITAWKILRSFETAAWEETSV